MPEYLKYIEPPRDKSGSVSNKGFSRGYSVDQSSLDLISHGADITKHTFGKAAKDVIEFTVYNHTGALYEDASEFDATLNSNILGWRVVEGKEVFIHRILNFTDYTDSRVTGNISILDYKYPGVNDNTEILISPANELIELGFLDGSYRVSISFRNDIVGSNDSSSKLIIKDISPSRTELKVIPRGLKTSKNPSDIALSFEFENFSNRKLVGATIYYDALKYMRDISFQSILDDKNTKTLIVDYDILLEQVLERFSFDSMYNLSRELDGLYEETRNLYHNIITLKYNDVFGESDYYTEYVKCVDYITSKSIRFNNIVTDIELVNLLDFYREIMYLGFDGEKVKETFVHRFDEYFVNLINFGNGKAYPILKYRRGLENVGENVKHQPMVIKLPEQLSSDIRVGHEFYISNIMYSDDIIQNVILNRRIESITYKMRGPDMRTISVGGTKKYNQDELTKVGLDISDKINEYFKKDIDDEMLNVDYSEFENFVRHSSARKRLDVFVYKLAKLSQLDRELEVYDIMQTNIEKEVGLGTISEDRAQDSLEILKKYEIASLTQKKTDMLEKLDGYERFMFYSEHSNAWPRKTITESGEKKNIPMSETDYVRMIQYKPMREFDPEWMKKHGTLYKPEPIPEIIDDFWKMDAYDWYVKMAEKADSYDKVNDDALVSNLPDFIVRESDNDEFLNFINFIGHHFDLIHLYIDGMGSVKLPKNNPMQGIPNQLVWHMLGFFGTPFVGQDEDEIEISLLGESGEDPESNTCGCDGGKKQFRMPTKERKMTIWRRILNNLPRILKTVGTEQSIRAMFRCYGVPDYLFKIREYGGIEYNTDLSDTAVYSFDTFDYYLNLTESNQYVSIKWNSENYETRTVELRVGFDAKRTDVSSENIIVVSTDTWTFGFEFEHNDKNEVIGDGFGRFYFKITDDSGSDIVYCPSKEDTGFTKKSGPIYVMGNHVYDIMIVKNDENSLEERRSDVEIYIKRVVDEEIPFDYFAGFPLKDSYSKNFNSSDTLFIGNYMGENFRGRVDRIRLYSLSLDEKRFENHILFNQSYDVSDPEQLSSTLIFKANFDYPYDLSPDIDQGYSVIENTSFRTDVPSYARCFNFGKQTEFPYDFIGENKRQYAKLPAFGAQVFNNNKVRIEEQSLTSILSYDSRATVKSTDRLTSDTNTLGVFFSSSDLINKEIIRFFGNFKLGDYIGNPSDEYEKNYKEFDEFRHLFFKHGFGRVDFQHYMNIVKAYIDPSLFENLKKLVPARTRLITGLLIEPTLLERHKIQRHPVEHMLMDVHNIDFDVSINESEMVSCGNEKTNNKNYDDYILSYFTEIDVIDSSQLTPIYSPNFGGEYMSEIFDISMFESYSEHGVWSRAGKLFKIEKTPKRLKRYSSMNSNFLDEESLYGDGNRLLRIDAMIAGTIRANITGKFYGRFQGQIDGEWVNRDGEIFFENTNVNGNFDGTLSAKLSSLGIVTEKYYLTQRRRRSRDDVGTSAEEINIRILSAGKFDGKIVEECVYDNVQRKNIPNPEIWKQGSISELVDKTKKDSLLLSETNISTNRVYEYEKDFYDVNVVSIPESVVKSKMYDIVLGYDIGIPNKTKSMQKVQGLYKGNFDIKNNTIFDAPHIHDYIIEVKETVISDSLVDIEIEESSGFTATQEGTFLFDLKLKKLEVTEDIPPREGDTEFRLIHELSEELELDEFLDTRHQIIKACERWTELIVSGTGVVMENELKVRFKLGRFGTGDSHGLAKTELDILENGFGRFDSPIIQGAVIIINTNIIKSYTYDILDTESNLSRLYYVVMHELGHALGITHKMWRVGRRNWIYDDTSGIYSDVQPSDVDDAYDLYYKPNLDETFLRSAAVYYYNEAFGVNIEGIPLEMGGGEGTNLSHPKERNVSFDKSYLGVDFAPGLDKELMTGIIDIPPILSKITLGFLEDLGYVVDYSKAEKFSYVTEPSSAKAWVDITKHVKDTGEVEYIPSSVRLSSPGYGFRQHISNTLEPTLHMVGTLVDDAIGFGEIIFNTGLQIINEKTIRGDSLQYLNKLVYSENAEPIHYINSTELYKIAVTDGGSGYEGGEYIFVEPQQGDTGSGATAKLVIEHGSVVGVELLEPGHGYHKTPKVFIGLPKKGRPAMAHAILRKPPTKLDIEIIAAGSEFKVGDKLNFNVVSAEYLIMHLNSQRTLVTKPPPGKLPELFRSVVFAREVLTPGNVPVSFGVDIVNSDEEHIFTISSFEYDVEEHPFSLISTEDFSESIPLHEYNFEQAPVFRGTSVKIILNTDTLLAIIDDNPSALFKLHISSSYGELDIPIFIVNEDSAETEYADIMKESSYDFVQPALNNECTDSISFVISSDTTNLDYSVYQEYSKIASVIVSEVDATGGIIEVSELPSAEVRVESSKLVAIETVDGRKEPSLNEFEYKLKQILGENTFEFSYDIPIEFSWDELEIFNLGFSLGNSGVNMQVANLGDNVQDEIHEITNPMGTGWTYNKEIENATLSVYVILNTKQEKQTQVEYHRFDYKYDFREKLYGEPLTIGSSIDIQRKFEVEKKFEVYNIKEIGLEDAEILDGYFPEHYKNRRNLFTTTSTNTWRTTVSESTGLPSRKPPIVRIRNVTQRTGVSDGTFDHFWFLDDTPVILTDEIIEGDEFDSSILDDYDKGTGVLPSVLELKYDFDSHEWGDCPTPTPTPTPTDSSSSTPTPTPTESSSSTPTPTSDD